MTLSMLAFWGPVAWVAVTVVRSAKRGHTTALSPSPPEDVLAERFARGEIDEATTSSAVPRSQRTHPHPLKPALTHLRSGPR